ncbi:MAG: NAD-dependent epimerase/dehydratase family protein [Alphaproteobacteria bacterium]|jgi:dihydroflavonol-4-reductase|nr:NAD-dependent epimerase/dehydratase family protein [Alphaproteobacteria bacterium]
MPTLLTGATGFVGSAVLRQLLFAGYDVRVLARSNSDRRNLEGLECEIAEGDLNEPESLRAAVRGCENLFHVAADYRLWTPDPTELYQTNGAATVDLFRAAADAGVTRMLYTSSVATLGINPDGRPSNETTPVSVDDMVGHYKRSKFLGEEAVSALVRDDGLPIVIVNPSTPIGPRDVKPTPTGRMIVEAAAGRMPAYVDTGLNVVHVEDVAVGHLLAFEKGQIGARYILGGEDLSLRDILTEIAAIVGRKPPRISLPRGPLFPLAYVTEWLAKLRNSAEPMLTVDSLRMSRKRMFFSSAKAEKQLGYTAGPALEALQDAIRWFRDNRYL